MNVTQFRQAARITTPVFFGYIAIGIPFGLMASNAGYPVWLAAAMSVFMYAGAGQYVAIGLFAAGAPLGAIAATELLVNIRHIVYGLSLIEKFKGAGKWRAYLAFALTDETYSLLTSCAVPRNADPGSFYGTIALLDQIYWVAGSVIGAAAGRLIPFSFEGVDFALTALFTVLLIEQIRKSRDIVPPAIGAAVTVALIVASRLAAIPSGNILLAAMALGMAALVAARSGHLREKNSDGGAE